MKRSPEIIVEQINRGMAEAERRAIDALSRYKFQMFGYWAAIWVHLNEISGGNHRNPFREFVVLAKQRRNQAITEEHRRRYSTAEYRERCLRAGQTEAATDEAISKL